ncbi:SMC-Scp complex subunit ScpB [Methylosinus sp. Sm6]|uniref:SMC-Scp complex subunit ScpB n=1 Tax=Methylosinus sp. Sm6 TaxID=2866948 RepID=UPI001C997CAD|nr:SMC-Scp complex subunit ScpB [Methylosinus sp. Sm6]MBY6242640.1 SMC-Scp complex subunit ScpB [Methylosinus sp. Sm6]
MTLRLAGREISRDVIGRLKRLDLIDVALRAPEPGAPFAYVTTWKFLAAFGLASLRDLPDLDRLEDEGLLQRPSYDGDLDGGPGTGRPIAVSRKCSRTAPMSMTGTDVDRRIG